MQDFVKIVNFSIKRRKEKNDWWSEISASEKESIEKGIQDAGNGKLTSHSNVKEIYEKWL